MGERFWIQDFETGLDCTSKNLDRLTDFLNRELENSTFSSQIPAGAHIFHGSYNDADLTREKMTAKINQLLAV